MWREKVERRHRRCVRRAPALLGQVTTCAAPGGTATAASDNTRRRGPPQGCESTRLAFDCLQRVHGGARAKDACEVLNGTSERAFVDYESRRSGNVCFLRWIGRIWLVASVLQSLARSSDSLGVCATRGTNSISDSLLGIEAADVALLVVRVLAAAIPSGVSICAAAGAARLINLIFLIVSILSYIVTGRHARPPSELVPSPWMKPSSRRGGSRTRARLLKATIHPSQTCL